ncbi:MAG: CBS domain-containing protein [Chloroflexi bacterium]|nr:CBS domain-containing protein [Chloroflexota bacterium]
MKVRDVMTSNVATVRTDTTLRDVATLLTERRISGAPVVDSSDACVGIISEADLLAKEAGPTVARRHPLEWVFGADPDPEHERRRAALTAGHAMSTPAVTIDADRPIREAANLMIERHVNRLPAVDGGRVVGIVTRADLVRAYLRMDSEIEHVIREEILRHTMWLDPTLFRISVSEGVVDIGGRVDRRSTATIIEKLVGLVDGVAQVRSTLAWDLDDSKFEPADSREREPGAASVSAREHPRAMHR